ncbi:MAG: hypothetical protein K2X27_04450 [Candidatus Obscuribacterales bacterium]|nr:hypothetical protein [Candidatus Obscuribacterales bacterium]
MTGPGERLDPLAIVSKIARQEKELQGKTFVAPYVGGGKVRLRLKGIICEMDAGGCPEGWCIMQALNASKARYLQAASPEMIKSYLDLLIRVRLIAVSEFDGKYWALSASDSGQKIRIEGPIPLHFSERLSSFETLYARFDGNNFWFEKIDRRRDPSIAKSLRKALSENIKPENLQCPGMVPQERLAYKMLYLEKNKGETLKSDDNSRISRALSHAGAYLDSFWYTERGQHISVRFQLDKREHVVEVNRSDLSVISAGICLSGQDANFDLSSLVGVLREADNSYYFD